VTGAYSEAQITVNAAKASDGFHRYARRMASAASRHCFQETIGKGQIIPRIPSGDTHKLGEALVRELPLTPLPDVEDGRAWEIVIPFEVTAGATKGVSATLFDAVLLRKGNEVAYIQTSKVLSPADSELRAKLVRTVARHMSSSFDQG
jgi:hypothetical protein